MTNTAPTVDQHHRFLASFLFGGTPSPGAREAVWRGYLDLSRTLHGVGVADPLGKLRRDAHEHVHGRVNHLLSVGPRDQHEFDDWHGAACNDIVKLFRDGGFPTFSIGQAQKWYNMALKYSLTLAAVGWLHAEDEPRLRAIGHAPLDSFFMDGLRRLNLGSPVPQLSRTWSRIADYDEYFGFQVWLRAATDCAPLDLEFHVWQGVSAERRVHPDIGLTER